MTTFQDVSVFILGASQQEVDAVWELCRARTKAIRSVEAANNMATLRPGDVVRITSGISPKYLVGAEGVVTPHAASKAGSVSVRLTQSVGRFSAISPIGVPASCLTKVES